MGAAQRRPGRADGVERIAPGPHGAAHASRPVDLAHLLTAPLLGLDANGRTITDRERIRGESNGARTPFRRSGSGGRRDAARWAARAWSQPGWLTWPRSP